MVNSTNNQTRNFWVCLKSTATILLVLLVMIAFSIFTGPEDSSLDGAIKGSITVILFIPILALMLLAYFGLITLKRKKSLTFAILMQNLFIVPFVVLLGYDAYIQLGVGQGGIAAISSFLLLNVLFGSGSLVWARSHAT